MDATASNTRPGGYILPAAVAVGTVCIAAIAGFVVGGTGGVAVGGVLDLSARATGFVGAAGNWLPLGFAFAAGMVATVNPCGFVMLPAYLGLYVGEEGSAVSHTLSARLRKALVVSGAVGLGFVVLFGASGLAISAGARPLIAVFPWIGLGVGVLMAALGGYVLAGGRLYSNWAMRAADNIGDPRDASMRGYFLFGVSYAVASLSCTLPIFLALVSSSLATGGLLFATGQFIVYALGMTFVIGLLTLGVAVFKGAMTGLAGKVMPYVQPAAAGILLLAGAYLIFYWLTEGGLAARLL